MNGGKLIVLDGIDGSGKSTQLNFLVSRLIKEGYTVSFLDFPQHGQRSAALVDDYLNGKYGSVDQVSPYVAAIFFACDRYDASFKIKSSLQEGKIVICDRYLASNSHQASKIKDPVERKKFWQWLLELEYSIFKIPRPNLTLILKVWPEIAFELADSGKITEPAKRALRQSYLGEKAKDIHESNLDHLRHTLSAYLELAQEYPTDFRMIDCFEGNQFLPPEIIHERIWSVVQSEVLSLQDEAMTTNK